MALIRCEKHGDISPAFVCPHVEKAVRDDRPLAFYRVETYDLIARNIVLCEDCINRWRAMGLSERDGFVLTAVPLCGGHLDEWIADRPEGASRMPLDGRALSGSEFQFKNSEKSLAFCNRIADEMERLFKISRSEAIRRINREWHGLDLSLDSGILFQEDAMHWANQIYYGNTDWWLPDSKVEPRPAP